MGKERIPMKRHLLYLLLALAVLATPAAFANTLTVRNLNDSGPNSLRQAIASASSGDTITFNVTGTITLTSGQLEIAKNLTIRGPGATSLAISGNNASRVFQIDSGATVAIDRLTIARGFASGGNGGGILNNGTLTVRDAILSGNTALNGGRGGGIANTGTLTVSNSTLSGNTASPSGGSGGLGGGIFNGGGARVTVSNSTLSGNSAFYGGGIGNVGTLTVSSSTLSGNSASYGGGIYSGARVTVSNSTLSGNRATHGGYGYGGGIFNGGSLTVSNSTLSGNGADYLGGGIFDNGTVTLSNSTLSGNSAAYGGGIFKDGTATATLHNTILANSPSGGNFYLNGGSITSQGYNLDSDGTCALGGFHDQSNVDPKLGPLANNGGPTLTHALLAGSPAIDTGDNTSAPSTDQRGLTRIADGNADGNALTDIGAYELQPSADLSISIRATPSPVKAGDPLLYSILVQNLGPTGAEGVVVRDVIPPNTSFLSAMTTQGSLTTPPVGYTGTLSAYLGALADGANGAVTITVKVLALKQATITNTAIVSSNTPDPVGSNNTATVVTSVK
jgi:uncharacterized repeat protein (TIGR01451 family)